MFRRVSVLAALALVVAAGCTMTPGGRPPEGPFEIALIASTDTRGEIEPCG